MASSSTWLNECAKPEICGQVITDGLIQSIAALKNQVCPAGNAGISCTRSKSATAGLTAAGLTAAVVAVLGALI